MLLVISAVAVTVLGIKFIAGFSPATRTVALNRLNMFSATAGVMTRVLTAIDAFRVIVEWSDTWPRDHTGRQIRNQRISRPPLSVPSPVAGKMRDPQQPAPSTPDVVKNGVAMTEMSEVEF